MTKPTHKGRTSGGPLPVLLVVLRRTAAVFQIISALVLLHPVIYFSAALRAHAFSIPYAFIFVSSIPSRSRRLHRPVSRLTPTAPARRRRCLDCHRRNQCTRSQLSRVSATVT